MLGGPRSVELVLVLLSVSKDELETKQSDPYLLVPSLETLRRHLGTTFKSPLQYYTAVLACSCVYSPPKLYVR